MSIPILMRTVAALKHSSIDSGEVAISSAISRGIASRVRFGEVSLSDWSRPEGMRTTVRPPLGR
jgi:hypothetical protein